MINRSQQDILNIFHDHKNLDYNYLNKITSQLVIIFSIANLFDYLIQILFCY
jgi:hypothetical protein